VFQNKNHAKLQMQQKSFCSSNYRKFVVTKIGFGLPNPAES